MKPRTLDWTLTALAIALAYWVMHNDYAMLLGVPLLLCVPFYLLARRRWYAAAVFVVVCPVTVTTLKAGWDYVRGDACLWAPGRPGPEIRNIDRQTRFRRTATGFPRHYGQRITRSINNATLRMLHGVLGPMPGTYTGPYPTRDEVEQALTTAEPVTWSQVAKGTVSVGGQSVRLSVGLGRHLVDVMDHDGELERSGALPRAARFAESVLLVEFPLSAGKRMVALIDGRSGKVFAYEGYLPRGAWDLPCPWT